MLTSEVCMCWASVLPRLRDQARGCPPLDVKPLGWAGPGLREAILCPQVPEQALNQAHPREVAHRDPLHPLKRSGC